MTREQTLAALGHLDDATVHLQHAFIATGDPTLLDLITDLQDRHDDLNQLLPHTVSQPPLL